MEKIHKWKMNCSVHGVVYNYNEDDTTAPSCPIVAADVIVPDSASIESTLDGSVQKNQNILTQDGLTSRPWGFNFTAIKSTTTTHDELLTEPLSLRGGIVITEGHKMNDEFDFEIVDVSNVLGYGPGAVLTEYVKRWQINPSGHQELKDESISNLVPAGVYLRVKYKSVGTVNDVKVGFTILGYK